MIGIRKTSLVKAVLTVLILFQLMLLQALTASPDLHENCHHHHDEDRHTCVVHLMLHGGYSKVLPDLVPVDLSAERILTTVIALIPAKITACHLTRGILTHSPPRGP